MTKRQKARIAKVIAQDCTCRWALQNDDGQNCVIGGLLKFAGYSMERLKALPNASYNALPQDAKDLLQKRYGIDKRTALEMIETNDQWNDVQMRRAQLLKELDYRVPDREPEN